MRSAAIILAVVSAIAAEAPYHLPRPAPHAPALVYHPSAPVAPPPPPPPPPPPAPFPQLPAPRPHQHSFAPIVQPQPPHVHGQGYNYQQPSIGPAFVYPALPANPPPAVHYPAPQPQPFPVPQPNPQTFHPQPINYPQQHQYIPPQQVNYPQPPPVSYPQPQPINYPQPVPISYPQPQISYGAPQPQPIPQPLPIQVPQPIRPLPALISPLPQAPSSHAFIAHQYNQLASQGYSYPQPAQHAIPTPIQAQPLANNAATSLTSYQADSNQYNQFTQQDQIHREALDDTVVSRVQNIIKENEHSSAKQAGYLSLVSGVSLENAKPSVEISSFVHSGLGGGQTLSVGQDTSSGSAATSSSASSAGLTSSYGAPTASAGSSQSGESSANFGFLPHTKPAISYGVPN